MFADSGAWKNFDDLEDSLTLEELSELHSAAIERQNRLIRVIAATQGVDLGPEESSSPAPKRMSENIYSSDAAKNGLIVDERDAAMFGFGLGFESVENG